MTELFISYARADRPVAQRLKLALKNLGWRVFMDEDIEAGEPWSEELIARLDSALSVLVLWSSNSIDSLWVHGEAARAFERGAYLGVLMDESEPPRLFRRFQGRSIQDWLASGDEADLEPLLRTLRAEVGDLPMHGILEPVKADQDVGAQHLHLVHSCWRVDKSTRYGVMPYQIHIVVHGHDSALKRVRSVEYRLPEYPEGHDRQQGGPAERLFELKELAEGFTIAQARVEVEQPGGRKGVVRLSRFINMTESGPRLLDQLGPRRSRTMAYFRAKLDSQPEDIRRALTLLESHDPAEAERQLRLDGVKEVAAKNAVTEAMGLRKTAR
ncbi:MAG: toll/interleukin-1 receptor domain-containing protein [Planctomycetota bacterium]